MPIEQRKIECAVLHGFNVARKRVDWFTINEYQTYKHAFKIAQQHASEYTDGELVVFDNRAVNTWLINAISNAIEPSDRVTELVYLQSVQYLLGELEKQSEGFINHFDRLLDSMIEETQMRIDSINFAK